jgi:subtilisin family serine protease
MMSQSSRSACGLLLLGLLAAPPSLSQAAPDGLIVRFEPGVLQPPPGRSAGAIEAFSFSTSALRNALVNEGVESLARMFPGFRSEDRFSKNLLGEPVLLEDLSEFYIASFHLGASVDADVRVRSIPGVTNAEWPQGGRLLSADPFFDKQWGLHNPPISICTPYNAPPPVADADINAPEAWIIQQGLDLSVRVGIIDTGIRASHEDLGGRVTPGVTFVPVAPQPSCPGGTIGCDEGTCTFGPLFSQDDDDNHGTAVAGIVAATGGNEKGVAGVAWGVTLVPIKAFGCGATPSTFSCNSARAIDWARLDSIPILNMSYQTFAPTAVERAAVRNAFYSGQLLVAGAGNANSPGGILAPASYAKMVCAVGAFFRNGRRWRDDLINDELLSQKGSSYGAAMDLAAPGGSMIATTDWGGMCYDNKYKDLTTCSDGFGGTSSAAPVVSGVAALLRSEYPSLVGEDIYQTMILTARHPDVDALGVEKAWDDSAGFGHVRADTALKFLAPPKVIIHRRETGPALFAVDTVQRYLANLPAVPTGTYAVYRHVWRKSFTFDTPFVSTPVAWVRSSGSYGIKDTLQYDFNEEVNWGRIVSISPTGCTVETNVYNIPFPPPLRSLWFPPLDPAVALTIVGVPVGGEGESFGEPVPANPTPTEQALVPKVFALRQNQPNPFSASTLIQFELPVEAEVRLEIFDASGRRISSLARGNWPAGFHSVKWDRRDQAGHAVGAGVYLYRIQAGSFRDQKKMVLLAR